MSKLTKDAISSKGYDPSTDSLNMSKNVDTELGGVRGAGERGPDASGGEGSLQYNTTQSWGADFAEQNKQKPMPASGYTGAGVAGPQLSSSGSAPAPGAMYMKPGEHVGWRGMHDADRTDRASQAYDASSADKPLAGNMAGDGIRSGPMGPAGGISSAPARADDKADLIRRVQEK